MRAWWFGPADGKLGYDDGRRVRKGVTHKVSTDRPLALCEYGLHASQLPLDALQYAPIHPVTWRVELVGDALRGKDKACAYKRRYIARVKDTDTVLRKFARLCALDVLHLWDAPDVVACYLKTGDESLGAATWDATWAATWDAARDATRDATKAATWDATKAATKAATWAAAGDAVGDAAWDAAWAAAREMQNKRLHRMLMQAAKGE